MSLLRQSIDVVQGEVQRYQNDVLRLFRASRMSAILIVTLQIFLASAPFILLQTIGDLIDHVIGARTAGIVTPFVYRYALQASAIVVTFTIGLSMAMQFTGVMKTLLQRGTWAIHIVLGWFLTTSLSPLIFIGVTAAYILLWRFRNELVQIALGAVILAAYLQVMHHVLTVTVMRAATIGEMVFWGGASSMFCLLLCMVTFRQAWQQRVEKKKLP